MKHGIYTSEISTPIQTLTNVDSGIIIAVGTAKFPENKPIICYNFAEFQKNFGYSGDFKYTLEEVAQVAFNHYNIAPVVFINVLNSAKHSKEIVQEYEGQDVIRIEGDILKDSIVLTSGEYIPPNNFTADDFEITEQTETIDDTTRTFKILTITNTEKVVDGKINFSYRKLSTALGGDPVSEEITLSGNSFELPEDIVVESIEITSGGVDTLVDVPFEVTTDSTGATIITITDEDAAVDDKIKIRYLEIDTGKVTAADIIGGTSAANGEKSGLELVDAVPAKFGIAATFTIIAPGFSENAEVAAAMTAKAKAVAGCYPSIAIADLDAPNYTSAIEIKNSSNLNSPFLISTFPKVSLNGKIYHLSTHLAALMNQVDAENGGIPFVSPSNKTLQIDAIVTDDGEEIYLTQEQANLLNEAGIVTAFSFSGFKAWGNRTSAVTNDPKDIWISCRRMFNYISTTLIRNYFSNLDQPINRRQIDSVLMSCNLWLASLVSQGALLKGEISFDSTENPVGELMAGRIVFNLLITPPTAAENITFKIQFDPSGFENIFA